VSQYRYPAEPAELGNNYPGPEQVFRVVLSKRVANFGVVVTGGTHVSPRIVFPGDENHLVGVPALPLNEDPYQDSYGQAEPVSAVLAPASRTYDVVFDSRSRSQAGPFTFRLWMNDVSSPTAKLPTPTVNRFGRLVLPVSDSGSGVDPSSISARIDGNRASAAYSAGRVTVQLGGVASGKHVLELVVSDYQETKNMEAYGEPLANTRVYRASFTVR
jgi:hypothetical protein